MSSYSKPAKFNFQKTIYMLQRGSIDPINIIENNEWRRCFYYNDSLNLISTKYDSTISFKVLCGNITHNEAKKVIEYTLGFDDPFLIRHLNNLPYPEKLQDAIGLNMPGYPDLFEAIIQIIMGQQVSVVVANKVRANFTIQFGTKLHYNGNDYYSFPRPQTVLNYTMEDLRKIGISYNKCKSLLVVATAFLENKDILNFNIKSDPLHVREVLTSLYGIGNWTVDWILMRHFRKFEIIPETDLAIRKSFTWWLNRKDLMSCNDIKQFEKEYYPFGGAIAFRVLYAYSNRLNRQGDA